MPANVLVTGPPRSGKTTVLEGVADRLERDGRTVGGIVCPEVRADGERVGFAIVDLLSGDRATLARVDRDAGPQVGKYRVDVAAVDRLCARALPRAREVADAIVIDEIAPMEVHSEAFVEQVRTALDADVPVVAAVHLRSTAGFIGEVKARADVELFDVTAGSREDLPERIARRMLERG